MAHQEPLFRYPRRCQACRHWINVGSPHERYESGGTRDSLFHLHCRSQQGAAATYAGGRYGLGGGSTAAGASSAFRKAYNPYDPEAIRERYKGVFGDDPPASKSPALFASPVRGGVKYTPVRRPASPSPLYSSQDIGFGQHGAPPSYSDCRDKNISINQLLAMPNLDIDHLFKTGFDVEKLCRFRGHRPTIVGDMAQRGMGYQHVLDSLNTHASQKTAASGGQTGAFGFASFLNFGARPEATGYQHVNDLPLTRTEWRILGVTDPQEIGMSSAKWLSLPEK